jgi:hypothetical protein
MIMYSKKIFLAISERGRGRARERERERERLRDRERERDVLAALSNAESGPGESLHNVHN